MTPCPPYSPGHRPLICEFLIPHSYERSSDVRASPCAVTALMDLKLCFAHKSFAILDDLSMRLRDESQTRCAVSEIPNLFFFKLLDRHFIL